MMENGQNLLCMLISNCHVDSSFDNTIIFFAGENKIMYNNNMKKYTNLTKIYKSFLSLTILFLLAFSFTFTITAQNSTGNNLDNQVEDVPKNLLIELFINIDCTTCPKAAFCLEDLAWGYDPGRVILTEFHIWDDGYDTPETNSRYDWYVGDGKKGTPDTFFNGMTQRIQGLCCDCGDINENYDGYQQIIEKHLGEISQLKITAEQNICSGKIIIQGEVSNTSHNLLQNLMLSGMVYYEGDDTKFYYLVKDIFERQDICQLTPMEKRKFSFVSELNLSKLEDSELERYYSIIFVQDKLSKEILQSFLVNK
jgi:hypothetical protein